MNKEKEQRAIEYLRMLEPEDFSAVGRSKT